MCRPPQSNSSTASFSRTSTPYPRVPVKLSGKKVILEVLSPRLYTNIEVSEMFASIISIVHHTYRRIHAYLTLLSYKYLYHGVAVAHHSY